MVLTLCTEISFAKKQAAVSGVPEEQPHLGFLSLLGLCFGTNCLWRLALRTAPTRALAGTSHLKDTLQTPFEPTDLAVVPAQGLVTLEPLLLNEAHQILSWGSNGGLLGEVLLVSHILPS